MESLLTVQTTSELIELQESQPDEHDRHDRPSYHQTEKKQTGSRGDSFLFRVMTDRTDIVFETALVQQARQPVFYYKSYASSSMIRLCQPTEPQGIKNIIEFP
jgi:hypothetical protein